MRSIDEGHVRVKKPIEFRTQAEEDMAWRGLFMSFPEPLACTVDRNPKKVNYLTSNNPLFLWIIGDLGIYMSEIISVMS